ncbi:MAG: hypothetical protein KJ950_06440 [Proteobacteria bacterium]|nr:hypothetical protein [Pseudomonadota bacterium]MBU1687171.1 hypothetical protein [Pseudomonadota bacterium]
MSCCIPNKILQLVERNLPLSVGWRSIDQVFFDATVDPAGITVTMTGSDLVISYGTSDQLTIENWTDADYRIEQFHFAWDSSTLTDFQMDGLIAP